MDSDPVILCNLHDISLWLIRKRTLTWHWLQNSQSDQSSCYKHHKHHHSHTSWVQPDSSFIIIKEGHPNSLIYISKINQMTCIGGILLICSCPLYQSGQHGLLLLLFRQPGVSGDCGLDDLLLQSNVSSRRIRAWNYVGPCLKLLST